MRALKGLESAISLSVTHWHMGENGSTFDLGPGVIPDPIHNAKYPYQIYLADHPKASGRATTPVLWDKARATGIVSIGPKLDFLAGSGK
jgi:putative glutathione S-transferase